MASFSARREDHFQKKLSETDLIFRFCKIGLRKNGRLLFCFVCCNTLFDFSLLFFNLSTHRAEKDAFKEKIIRYTVWELLNRCTWYILCTLVLLKKKFNFSKNIFEKKTEKNYFHLFSYVNKIEKVRVKKVNNFFFQIFFQKCFLKN